MPCASTIPALKPFRRGPQCTSLRTFAVTNHVKLKCGCRSDQTTGRCHHFSLLCGGGVVVADEVEQAVGEQKADLGGQVSLPGSGLAQGSVEGDHDVAEHARSLARLALIHGEREHVGGPILATMLAIEHLDPGVVGQEHAELRVDEVQGRQHAIRHFPDQP